MKKLALLFLSFIFLTACKEEVIEKPEPLLGQDQMASILYDITLLQAMNSYTPGTLQENDIILREYIYEKYDIDSVTFAQNHRYYASKLEEYKKIQEKIMKRLKAEKIVIDSLVKIEEKAGKDEKKVSIDSTTITRFNPVRE